MNSELGGLEKKFFIKIYNLPYPYITQHFMRKQGNKPDLHYKEALQNNSRCNTSIQLTSGKES